MSVQSDLCIQTQQKYKLNVMIAQHLTKTLCGVFVLTVHASHACPCCSLFCSLPVFAVFIMIKLKLCCNVCNQVAKFYILYIGIPFLNILLWPVDILPSLIWLYDYSLYPLCFFPLNCLGCLSKQETAKFTKCHLRTACIESRRVR